MTGEEDLSQLKKQFHKCMPVFIALGDEVRLTIMEALSGALLESRKNLPGGAAQGLNVKEITNKTHLSRPAISHHLKILKDAGLIDSRQEGTSNYYYLTVADSTKEMMALGAALQNILDLQ